ncbi:MAG: hypothetical protein COX62_02950 [Deltaproteobacteria bacterium CG_4_10_14_0_2_um_filter_43_8]|nr:MAG: hypothetical protein COV43_03640 [Deltaproteobacteria bacterium CG11_big_fil_rev_8_21_14_0_20_42_23]PJA21227.1 MAG: hypothetical protein COX62_02950 [Deltaproteobacteria bacterium CG_4_10_14_0_2_um_filter_43_8]PJC64818.1 MAG: hypothetical protein CO021_02250 [Deltaproteobacteria bacterium CG_4_9_14_0_2_um_filter_42_21]
MKTVIAFSFALALFCASPLLSSADQGDRHGMMNERMTQQLNLNEEQKNKISELKKKYQAETKPLFDQKKSSYEKMNSEKNCKHVGCRIEKNS